jgi:fibronectin-binding autotransporter adhesin
MVMVNGGTNTVQTLAGANLYTGGTRVIKGTLIVANTSGNGTGTGNVTVESTNAFLRIGNGAANGSVSAGVITNNGLVSLNRSDDFTFTNLITGSGILEKANTNIVTINVANTHTGGTTINGPSTSSGASVLRISNPAAVGSTAGVVTIGNRGTLQLTNGITLVNTVTIGAKPSTAVAGSPNVENIGGSNTLAGDLQLLQNGAQGWIFISTAGYLRIAKSNTPVDATLTSQNTTRPVWLRGDGVGEWSGGLCDNTVTNISLRKDGLGTWILGGASTYTGPTVVSNGTLLVNGTTAAKGSVTVEGGTLGGSGVISVPVVVNAAGFLAPGNSTNSIGTLTISNSLTLSGTNLMEVSHSSCDKVQGVTSLTLGGTLQVVTNGALLGGEVFKLFSATSFTGDFATYVLPPLPPPLAWDTNSVPVDGTLKVTGGVPQPPTLGVSRGGSGFEFTWTGSYKLQAQTNALAVGIATNWFDYPGGGSSPVTVPFNPANPAVFFRLKSL